MLHIVEAACKFTSDFAQGTVVVESDEVRNFPQAIEELQATDARNIALGFAARHGCADPRINGNATHPYPINSEGMQLDMVVGESGEKLPPAHPRMQIARYRTDIPVTKRII